MLQFIQKPGATPMFDLHLTISNKASPQLAAVMYYLRQNLLQFLHPPKYKTSQADWQFVVRFCYIIQTFYRNVPPIKTT